MIIYLTLIVFRLGFLEQGGEVIIITGRLDQRGQHRTVLSLRVLVPLSFNLVREVFGHGVVDVVQVPIRIVGVGRVVPNLGDPLSDWLGQLEVADQNAPSLLGDLLLREFVKHHRRALEAVDGIADRVLNESNVQAVAMQTAHVEFWLQGHLTVGADEAKDA